MVSTPTDSIYTTDHNRLSDFYSAAYQNPPFDPRRYSTNPYYSQLQQGILIRNGTGKSSGPLGSSTGVANAAKAGVLDSVKLRFLYNPSDLTESGSPSDTLFPDVAGQNGDTNDTASLIGATTVSISFSLLFDRTYEINQGYNTPGQTSDNPTQVNQYSHLSGVQVDVLTFKALIGVPLNGEGLPLYLPVHLYLGGVSSPSFYGVINNYSVAYSHFSTYMVPMRAAISIGMTQWLDGSNTDISGGTSNTTPLGTAPGSTPKAGSGVVAGPAQGLNLTLPSNTWFGG